jgi:hypothetical protein
MEEVKFVYVNREGTKSFLASLNLSITSICLQINVFDWEVGCAFSSGARSKNLDCMPHI